MQRLRGSPIWLRLVVSVMPAMVVPAIVAPALAQPAETLKVIQPGTAAPVTLQLQPRLCLHYPHEACLLKLQVSWPAGTAACLYKKAENTPLLCGDGAPQQIQLALGSHTRFELRAQQQNTLLAERLVRVLQVDLNAGDQLLKRSPSSWGQP